MDPDRGLPARYAAVEEEYRALRAGCGLLDRTSAFLVEATGADRQRFLNGMTSCDLKSLGAGQGAYGFATNARGRVLADLVALVLDDRIWVELPPAAGEEILTHLRRYLIADRVELEASSDRVACTLVGPSTWRVLAAAAAADGPHDLWTHRRAELFGRPVRLVADGRFGAPACTVWLPADAAPELVKRLLAAGERLGLAPVGSDAWEILRVESGIPLFGQDFGPDNLPQETGLEPVAVSYAKGCYLGQEVIARVHYRGKVHRGLRGLLIEGDRVPTTGSVIEHQGEEVGRLGSAVFSLTLGRPVGLAVLHRKGAATGTRVQIAGGREATVADLPLVEVGGPPAGSGSA